MLGPGMITVADPWTAELHAMAIGLATGMRGWIMVCVAVFTPTLQDPAALGRNEEECPAAAFGMRAPASHTLIWKSFEFSVRFAK